MVINDYVTSKRFIKEEPKLSFLYSNMYDIISTTIDLNKLCRGLPELITCYSTERVCEFVSMNGDDYIIYDQYLGQTFNMLNRIFFNSSDKYDVISYAYKILAEIYHSVSRTEISQLCLIAYLENRDEHKSYQNEQDYAVRCIYTYFQEFFVLMHEVAHWHLSSKEKAAMIHAKRSQLIDYFRYLQAIDVPNLTHSILDDLDAVLGESYGNTQEYVDSEQYKKIDISFGIAMDKFFGAAIELIRTNDDFIEECLCDEIATSFLKEIMFSMRGIDTEECFQIIYLGLQNLELLTILRAEALKTKRSDDPPSYLIELCLRNGHFRHIVPLSVGDFDSDGIEKCHQRFVYTNRKFTKIIKDPVLFLLTNSLNDLIQMDLKGEAPIKMTDNEYNELIRAL